MTCFIWRLNARSTHISRSRLSTTGPPRAEKGHMSLGFHINSRIFYWTQGTLAGPIPVLPWVFSDDFMFPGEPGMMNSHVENHTEWESTAHARGGRPVPESHYFESFSKQIPNLEDSGTIPVDPKNIHTRQQPQAVLINDLRWNPFQDFSRCFSGFRFH